MAIGNTLVSCICMNLHKRLETRTESTKKRMKVNEQEVEESGGWIGQHGENRRVGK